MKKKCTESMKQGKIERLMLSVADFYSFSRCLLSDLAKILFLSSVSHIHFNDIFFLSFFVQNLHYLFIFFIVIKSAKKTVVKFP